MNRTGKTIAVMIAALGTAAAGTQAFAYDGWRGRHEGPPHREHRMRGDFWLNGLKAQLNITADQDAAWKDFVNALHESRPPRPDREKGEWKPSAALTPAPQVFKDRADRMELRAKAAEQRAAAINKLYAVLTPVQRAIIDTHLADARHHFHRR